MRSDHWLHDTLSLADVQRALTLQICQLVLSTVPFSQSPPKAVVLDEGGVLLCFCFVKHA